jgi:F-type H+-transporting ATPase subunit delta
MRTDPKLTRVYAEALIDIAVEQNQLEAIEQELHDAAHAFTADADVWAFFRSPVMQPEDKISALTRALKSQLSATLYNFLAVLAQRRRFEFLPSVATQFSALVDEKLGRRHVSVFSARKLGEAEAAQLRDVVQSYLKKTVILDEQVREDLVGGVLVRAGDMVIDTSILSRLKRLKQTMLNRKIAGEVYYEN